VRVLVDTNIVLDFLLQREPFFRDAELLFQAIESEHIIGYVTATTLTDIFYIARKQTRDMAQARQAVSEILTAMVICPIDRGVLESALDSGFADFEDAVQIFAAVSQGLEIILTRDQKGFTDSPIPVLSIQKLLERL
jgi:predicted nucleic acid-binding protein